MTVAKDRVNDAPATPSIDPDEVAKFSAMAADWWNPRGKFRPLHKFLKINTGETETQGKMFELNNLSQDARTTMRRSI